MNGELILKGYKFSKKLILNLQDKTVLTGKDNFMAFEIFNMLESYFNRKVFSDYYLDMDTLLILNGNKLSGNEFSVFRMHPTVNLTEELKISKKSVLGQVVNELFPESSDKTFPVAEALQKYVLEELNSITDNYGVSFIFEGGDIFTLAKILAPVVKENGQDILAKDHDQFYCKTMLLQLVSRLETKKKKMLLVELPEYGLRDKEIEDFFELLAAASIDDIIIYTHKKNILRVITQVFNYNVMKNGRIIGFDDYDELEKELLEIFNSCSKNEIEQKVIEYIFDSSNTSAGEDEFRSIMEMFLN